MTAKRKKKKAGLLILILLLLAVLLFFAFWQRLTVSRYTVSFDTLPKSFDGFRIVQVTDLHCARFGDRQAELCAKIESLEPDIIVFTGDMNDQHLLDLEPTRELCAAFSGKVPLYAVTGNHDLWVSRSAFQKLQALYTEYGVTLLRGGREKITRGSDFIYLHGDDVPAHWGNNSARAFPCRNRNARRLQYSAVSPRKRLSRHINPWV